MPPCEVAARLTDHVLPHVPPRQWVLSVPKRLRPYLHRDVRVAGAVAHYHLVVLDGVFSEADDSEIEFHGAHDPRPDRGAHVESVVQQRVLRYFRRQGLLDELDAAGMLTWQGSGGFSVDASVRIEAEDRAGIERLARGSLSSRGSPTALWHPHRPLPSSPPLSLLTPCPVLPRLSPRKAL